jgi:Family of unknown function (DUF6519)
MRIDVSGDSFDARNGYTRVLLQQGRPLLDRDWNEHTEIVSTQIRNLTRAIYGPYGGPAGGRCGFIPRLQDGELQFQTGSYSIDGLFLSCGEGETYFNQRNFTPPAFETGRSYLIYLEALEREVTSAEQSALLDDALPGVDIAARGQVVSRIMHKEWPRDGSRESVAHSVIETCNKLMSQLKEEQTPTDILLKDIFSDQEETLKRLANDNLNQLFRLEYNGNNEWKLSFNNGFALFPIVSVARSDLLIAKGALSEWVPQADQTVEILKESDVIFNDAGELRLVVAAGPQDTGSADSNEKWSIKISEIISDDAKYVRVWDKTLTTNIPDDSIKKIRKGDFWLVPTRRGHIDLDTAMLRRVQRNVGPLALVNIGEDGKVSEIVYRFQRIASVQWRDVRDDIDIDPSARVTHPNIGV